MCSQVVFPQDFACIRMVCGAPGKLHGCIYKQVEKTLEMKKME